MCVCTCLILACLFVQEGEREREIERALCLQPSVKNAGISLAAEIDVLILDLPLDSKVTKTRRSQRLVRGAVTPA